MRGRISWLVLLTTSTVVASFVVPLCLLVQTLATDRAVAAVDQEARNVAILVAGVDDPGDLAQVVADVDSRAAPQTSVLLPGGRVIGPDQEMAEDPEVVRSRAGESFQVADDDGVRVLLQVALPGGTAVVRSSLPDTAAREGVLTAWAAIIGLGLVLLALALVLARQLARRVSRPLLQVASAAHRLRAGELDARARVTGTEETRELARALNGLAERTTELLAAERAAVADLSHRLRTPVTALRLDAEAVSDPELRDRLQAHIGSLQRSIDAVVKEARRPVRSDLAQGCDAAEVTARRVAYWSALAEDQRRAVTARVAPGPLPVAVAPGDLADLVDILIDNVFAHTPEGTGFEVSLAADGGQALLTVADDGPGIGDAVGGRRPGSSGLGLDIARRTAGSAGGSLGVADAGDHAGTRVEVRFPLTPR